MRILLSNDDGIGAEGILALADELKKYHDVYIAAPDRQRSAASHSVTYYYTEHTGRRVQIDGVKQAWAISGTPADCVYYGIYGLMEEKPDLVITGINHGQNLSTDVIYSGTVGSAGEAMIAGIPAMAVSLCSYTSKEFTAAAKIARSLIPHFMNDPDRLNYVLSVNVPDLPMEEIRGFRVTPLEGARVYSKTITVTDSPDGSFRLTCPPEPGVAIDYGAFEPGDVTAVQEGYVSLTPLMHDMCDHAQRRRMKQAEELKIGEIR